MNKHLILVLLLGFFLWSACKEKDMLLYTDENAPAPKAVSSVQAVRTPGGAKLFYKVPADNNLLYVKAVYEINQGTRESKASIHQDTLVLEGYADTLEHEVKVYTVGKNTKESQPVTLKIRPLSAPVNNVFATMQLKETFGGTAVSFVNVDEAPLAIVVLYDSTGRGDWTEADTYHTKAPKGAFSVRGFDTVATRFAAYARDRWNNKSDTISVTLKPWFETKLDRTLMKEVNLPTDENIGHVFSGLAPRSISFLFNNIFGTGSVNDCFHTRPSANRMPQWFTFDLGKQYNLSRFKFYHRGGTAGYYRPADPKRFEIYGSNNPNPDGSWDSWTLLGTFSSFKPSGDAVTPTKEDEEYAVVNGEDFDFPPGTPPVRYLRWKTVETWGNAQYIYIAELMFWGAQN